MLSTIFTIVNIVDNQYRKIMLFLFLCFFQKFFQKFFF